ncbi:MAG: HAMP domain-containing protein [Polyangiaceae bacterium]|nr:HAMP domain-containing protein [Polyangiaceae bacterium]
MGLARQLWLVLLLPIAVTLGLYGLATHRARDRLVRSEASEELENQAVLVEAALTGAVQRGQVELLKQRVERLARADRILGIAAFEASGRTLLVTDHVAKAAADLSQLAQRALARGQDLEEERALDGIPVLVRTVTFSGDPGGSPVVAMVVRDLRYIDDLATTMNRTLIIAGAALLALTAVVAALASRATVGRPVGAIVAGVERVAGGDLHVQVPERGAEELRRLSRAFNAMTARLAEARARAEREEAARIAEEEARLAVERRLQHAQALAAGGQVAASMGHEIGSPLNVVLGRARRLADQPGCPEPIRGELETIAAQSERISRIVARLLTAARPARSHGRTSDIAQVAQEALAFLAPECRHRRVRARLEPGAAPAVAALDPDRLFQVIFNLCLNAIQAQREGGEIMVRVSPAAGRKVSFEVEDRGPGVPPDVAPHVFDAFFTSKGDGGGTGLGLTIVSGIVREVGGAVALAPAEPTGARFRVTLPSAGSSAAPAAEDRS